MGRLRPYGIYNISALAFAISALAFVISALAFVISALAFVISAIAFVISALAFVISALAFVISALAFAISAIPTVGNHSNTVFCNGAMSDDKPYGYTFLHSPGINAATAYLGVLKIGAIAVSLNVMNESKRTYIAQHIQMKYKIVSRGVGARQCRAPTGVPN